MSTAKTNAQHKRGLLQLRSDAPPAKRPWPWTNRRSERRDAVRSKRRIDRSMRNLNERRAHPELRGHSGQIVLTLRRENHEAVAICDRNARPIENRSSQIELADAVHSKRRIDIQPIAGETKRDKLVLAPSLTVLRVIGIALTFVFEFSLAVRRVFGIATTDELAHIVKALLTALWIFGLATTHAFELALVGFGRVMTPFELLGRDFRHRYFSVGWVSEVKLDDGLPGSTWAQNSMPPAPHRIRFGLSHLSWASARVSLTSIQSRVNASPMLPSQRPPCGYDV
jgi:hypothetical protein